MGFRFKGNPTSYGLADFYVIIPANISATEPDENYLPVLKKNSTFSSADGVTFTLNEDIRFANSDNEKVVAQVDSNSGAILSFAVKASGEVISGELFQEKIIVGGFERFRKVQLSAIDISEVVSVIDSNGNEYYEVDYLSQDVVYKGVLNRDNNKDTTTSTLRPYAVPRRFTTERLEQGVAIQFGFGSERDIVADPFIDPSKVILDVHSKDYVSDVSFDPSNLLKSDKLGVSPSNTTLTITYRKNSSDNVNVSSNGLVNVDGPILEFDDPSSLTTEKMASVVDSLQVNNEEPITGDVSLPNISELKERIYNVYAAQNRAVTALDYKSLCYSMPTKFGSIKRVSISKDPGSLKRNLNIYVLSEDVNGYFITANSTIKKNLKQWLNQGRMINDTVDILDAKIINIGIEFDIISNISSNKFEVLAEAIEELSAFYNNKLDVGEPFYISDVYNVLNKMPDVVDTTKVKIVQKTGGSYSSTVIFDVANNMSPDERYIVVPDNAVLELKYPTIDIKGTVK